MYNKLWSKIIDFDVSDLQQIDESTYAIPIMMTENVTYFVDTVNGALLTKWDLLNHFANVEHGFS